MHLVSYISESIWQMGSDNNSTTDISALLHIGNVKQAYRRTNIVNYTLQMLTQNAMCTGLDYMEEKLSHLALPHWYNINSTEVFDPLSATYKWQNTCGAHLLLLQYCQEKSFFRPILPQVHWLRKTHVCGVCSRIKLISLRDASEDFRIPHCGQLFHTPIEGDWWHEFCGLVHGYDQIAFQDSIFIKFQNGLLYYHQSFHCTTSVEHLGLDCKVEYTNANQGIMPESHNIWVQYIDSDLDNIFQDWFFVFLYYTLAGLEHIRLSNCTSAWPSAKWYRPFEYVREVSTMDIMSSSSTICGGDSNKVQLSTWFGWLCWQVHPCCQRDW